MIERVRSIFESLAGAPAAVLGASLLIYAVYRMARHEILLFGSVSTDDRGEAAGKPPAYRYSFLIQNLEEVTFPGPFEVILRDRRYADEADRRFEVDVYAGPRHITAYGVPGRSLQAPSEWHGSFECLTPFDTWRIEVVTHSKWVELEIDTGAANDSMFHRLIVDLHPRQIAVDAEHPSSQVFKGAATTPGLPILISIVTAAVLTYVGAIGIIDWNREFFGIAEFPFASNDLFVVAGLIALLWLGYRRIQRPVYPIIQGYFLKTRVKNGKPPERQTKKKSPAPQSEVT
jgi:hypothetical protein